MRIRKPYSIILIAILSFLIGYFNTYLGAWFLNKDTLIGLLLVVVVLMYSYICYSEIRKIRTQENNRRTEEENGDLRRAFHSDFEKLKELQTETRNEVKQLKHIQKELHNSVETLKK